MEKRYLMVIKKEDNYYIVLSSLGAMVVGDLKLIESMVSNTFTGTSKRDSKYMMDVLPTFSTYVVPLEFESPEELMEDIIKSIEPKYFNKLGIIGVLCDDSKINFEGLDDYNIELIKKNDKALLEYKQTKEN